MTGHLIMAATASGAVLGSAAGSALSRWPEGGSVARPTRSRCAGCGATVGARDLVPIVSWLALRGRCRRCGVSIDVRLVLLESASAVAVTAVTLVHGPSAFSGLLALGCVAVLLATLTDLERRTIPDRLTLPLAMLSVPAMVLLASSRGARLEVLAWAVLLPLLLEGAARLTASSGGRRLIGGGDVKLLIGLLALSAGVTSGPARLLTLAFVLGGIHATVGLLSGAVHRGDRLPFAPSIAVAFLMVVLRPHTLMPIGGILEVLR